MNYDETELWKEIENYENYQVSSYGQIANTTLGIMMKQRETENGYLKVCLCADGLKRDFYVHRIVGEAFLDNPDDKFYIDHRDRDKKNNQVSNLRFCTCQENQWNSKRPISNTSGHKNICWSKHAKKYRVILRGSDGKKKHIGYFESIAKAIEARDTATKNLHGEFYCSE